MYLTYLKSYNHAPEKLPPDGRLTKLTLKFYVIRRTGRGEQTNGSADFENIFPDFNSGFG